MTRGADPSTRTAFGLTTLDFAKRQGNEPFVKNLLEAGIRDESPVPAAPKPNPAASIRAAVERAIPPLQRCDAAFFERAGCVSCHNNSLTAMTVSDARSRGFRVNEQIASSQLKKISAFLQDNAERALENEGIPGAIDTVSYILLGMAAEKYPSDSITDVWARFAKNSQSPDGRFKCRAVRPPLETSDLQVTAATIRSLLAYAPKSQQPEYRKAVDRAVRWLEKAEPAEHGGSRLPGTGIDLGRRQSRNGPEERIAASDVAAIRWRLGTDRPAPVRCLCNRPGAGGVAAIGDRSP